MRVTRFDGRSIAYQGIEFQGSPREVFWSRYIEPFLEDLTVQEIAAAVATARERGVDAKQLLSEVEGLLLSSCKKVFNRMADIDQRLHGKGYPRSVPLRAIEDKYEPMKEFIERRIRAEIEIWRPKRRHEGWYERNKFLVWLIGTIVGVGSLIVAVVGLIVKLL